MLRPSRIVILSLAVVAAGACGSPAPSADPRGSPSAAPTVTAVVATATAAAATSVASPDPSPSAAPTSAATPADPTTGGPPAAHLAAEGGDPVTGSLGTYTWGDSGSDAPWLQGAPITVGAGEPLSVVFDPPFPVDTWGARYVPAGSDSGAGAAVLGQGVGIPSFAAPPAGSWTVELRASFGAGHGTASWFWRLEVR